MASKITQMTENTAPVGTDLIEIVTDPGGTPLNQKVSFANATKGLSAVVGDSGSGGTKGLVPAPGAGDAAANKFLHAGGTWTAPSTGSGLAFELVVACSDLDTALAAGTAQMTFPWPVAVTLISVHAFLVTPQTSGSIFTVDVNEAGVSILSTKITIDNGETDSTTAATAPVISDTGLAAMAKITVDIDQIGDGTAKGLYLVFISIRA